MRSAKQWMDDNDPAWADDHGRKPELSESVIRAIQRDAMEHAASIASGTTTKGGCYGDAYTAACNIRAAISSIQ